MKIYKDVFTGDELFSDTYPMKLVGECVYEIYGKHETRKEGEVVLAGSNASAEGEDADEGCDESSVSGIDVILNHRLCETFFGNKKEYQDYLKLYMRRVVKHLEENNRGNEVEAFKTNINGVMKPLLGAKFKDLQFYTGETFDISKGMIIMLDYKEFNGVERPCFIAFKHGLEEEKV